MCIDVHLRSRQSTLSTLLYSQQDGLFIKNACLFKMTRTCKKQLNPSHYGRCMPPMNICPHVCASLQAANRSLCKPCRMSNSGSPTNTEQDPPATQQMKSQATHTGRNWKRSLMLPAARPERTHMHRSGHPHKYCYRSHST